MLENIFIALRSIKGQLLRTILTVLIIAFGIMSLVGMLTSIDVLEQSVTSNFGALGANTFGIVKEKGNVRAHGARSLNDRPDLDWDNARLFKERYEFPAIVSISTNVSNNATLQYQTTKTQPNISVFAGDENYLIAAGRKLQVGRTFSLNEISSSSSVIVIGAETAENLFGNALAAIDKTMLVGSRSYLVIGVLEKSGSGFGGGRDREVIIPLGNYRAFYASGKTSYQIQVMVNDVNMMDAAVEEARGVFRPIRKLRPYEDDNFDFNRSDGLIEEVSSLTGYMAGGALVIGLITILGALTGLINIMLVSVNERTREIGVRMAVGATKRTIATQFLVESIVICQLGGALGVFFGIVIGNLVAVIIGGTFVLPVLWMTLAVILCFIVGVIAGAYPAIRAAKLDPVVALRYD